MLLRHLATTRDDDTKRAPLGTEMQFCGALDGNNLWGSGHKRMVDLVKRYIKWGRQDDRVSPGASGVHTLIVGLSKAYAAAGPPGDRCHDRW
jgi:hypothetical protein